MLQKKNFVKGINSDTADELLPNGMDRYRLDVRVISPENGNMGYIETMNGNTLVDYALPFGNNYCIGSREYELVGKVYYFVFNDELNHSILEYDIAENVVNLVLSGSFLNFDREYLITGINFVELDPDNHLMYWTDNLNEPRKLNIEKAKFYSAGDYVNGYKSPFDPEWINRIKIPPTTPSYKWDNDTTKDINYLLNKLYTFKLRFVYDDKEISACSPISSYDYPNVVRSGGASGPTDTQDNFIQINVSTGSSIVKRIQILAKEVNEVNYYQIADLDKSNLGISDDSIYTYVWYNDNTAIPVEINQSIKLFDNVPLKSQSQEIMTNRIMDGFITEGYDPVEIDFKMDYLKFWSGSVHEIYQDYVDNTGVLAQKSYLKAGGVYTFGIVYYDSPNRSGVTNINSGNILDIQNNGKYGTTLYVPFFNYFDGNSPYNNSTGHAMPDLEMKFKWSLYNLAPSWATHYQIVRSKNKYCDKFFQFCAEAIRYVDTDGNDVDASVSTDIYIYINNSYDRYKAETGQSALVFSPVKGDRIRFLANPIYSQINDYPVLQTPNALQYIGYNLSALTVLDFQFHTPPVTPSPALMNMGDSEIISFDPATGIVHIKNSSNIPHWLLPGVLFEVYAPSSTVTGGELVFEIGELYDIDVDSNGNRVHKGSGVDQYVSSGHILTNGTIKSITIPTGSISPQPQYTRVKVSAGDSSFSGLPYTWYGYVNSWSVNTPTGLDTVVITIDNTGSINGPGSAVPGDDITFIVAAQGFLKSGDVYRPYMNMPWQMTGYGQGSKFDPVPTSLQIYRAYGYIESMNASYYFSSAASDYGRENKVDPNYRQVTRRSTIRYSELFVPETNINGLSSVYDTSFETYEDQYGGIYKLYGEDQRLICFQELRVGQVPVHQVIYNAQDLTQTVGASEVVLNPQMIYYAGVYGIGKNPESFAVYAKSKYFLDMKRGALCRLSVDGITPISKTAFQDKFFTDMCNNRLNKKGGTPRAHGVYDVKFNEYIISFEDYTYLKDGELGKGKFTTTPGDTIAFNEKINEFTTHYSFLPDMMCSAGVNIVSMKEGALYTHNTNSNNNEFYGSISYPEIWVVLNAAPENVKVFEAIGLACPYAWEAYEITTPGGQLSNLIVDDYQIKEGLNYAHIWRDTNTPNLVPGTELFEGDPMRDRTFLIKLKYNIIASGLFSLQPTKIYSIDLKYIVSNLHNR